MTPEKRADIAERYGWQEGEREAMQRDMAERRRRDAHDEMVAWAKARNAERAEAERQAQAEPSRIQQSTKAEPMTQATDGWVGYIKRQIDKRERAMEGAVADVVGIESKARQKLEAEHAVTRQELLALKRELAELRGEFKMRAALDDLQARLAKLETPPRLSCG